MRRQTILLTGATGYIGGRLLTRLSAQGHAVRCLARNPAYLEQRLPPGATVVRGDVRDQASLVRALTGIDTAYYLVHAMGEASGFEAHELEGATCFAAAARVAGVRRIIYLGALGEEHADLSPHLRSRQEVGRILRESGVPTLELRASIVIGSGSLSFEMVRALTEHLPVMVMPRWVTIKAQPIGIQDLLAYLVASLDVPLTGSLVVEIGGADRVSYRGMMKEYARQRGLHRLMVPVPVLTPRLSSLWLGLVTPLYARVGRKLIESIRHPTVVNDPLARQLFPIAPVGTAEAILFALDHEDRAYAETYWSDAPSAAGLPAVAPPAPPGNRLTDVREVLVEASAGACFAALNTLGGEEGWPAFDVLWRIRGAVDLLLGGVGLRRGRPAGRPLRAGDALDFWRVEVCEPGRRLRLYAEMRLPGRAWLDFQIHPDANGCLLRQVAEFDPAGLAGRLYWYALVPIHAAIFSGMVTALAARAKAFPVETAA
jgi:uncharacterized protein YbjT (DUF2867 family)